MKSLLNTIQEKLVINKNSKIKKPKELYEETEYKGVFLGFAHSITIDEVKKYSKFDINVYYQILYKIIDKFENKLNGKTFISLIYHHTYNKYYRISFIVNILGSDIGRIGFDYDIDDPEILLTGQHVVFDTSEDVVDYDINRIAKSIQNKLKEYIGGNLEIFKN